MDNLNDMLSTPHNQATKEAWLRAIAIQLAQMNDTLAALYFGFSPVVESEGQEIVVELEEPLEAPVSEETVEPKPKKLKTTKV